VDGETWLRAKRAAHETIKMLVVFLTLGYAVLAIWAYYQPERMHDVIFSAIFQTIWWTFAFALDGPSARFWKTVRLD
jgi:hypothetical protein